MKLLKFVAILSFLVLNACGQEQKKDTVAKEVQENLWSCYLYSDIKFKTVCYKTNILET